MKIAVIGSRSICAVEIDTYLSDAEEIVLGGALGVDTCAAAYAEKTEKPCEVILQEPLS